MKHTKKRLSVFLALSLLLPLFFAANSVRARAASAVGGTFGENAALRWTLDDAGTLTVSGVGEIPDYEDSDAPWQSYRMEAVLSGLNAGETASIEEALANTGL